MVFSILKGRHTIHILILWLVSLVTASCSTHRNCHCSLRADYTFQQLTMMTVPTQKNAKKLLCLLNL